MDARLLRGTTNVDIRCFRAAIADVFRDAGVKEVEVLGDDGNVSSEVMDIDIAQPGAVDGDGARVGFVETLEERRDGGFSGTGGTDDGNAFSAGDGEVNILEDRSFGTCGVGKVDVLERNMASDRRAEGAGGF